MMPAIISPSYRDSALCEEEALVNPRDEIEAADASAEPPQNLKPSWDRLNGRLRLGIRVIKRVRSIRQAKNVVLILDSFEDLGWPERVDDPLPSHPDIDRVERLYEAVKSLNDRLKLIRFSTVGAGICWNRQDCYFRSPRTLPEEFRIASRIMPCIGELHHYTELPTCRLTQPVRR